MNRTGRLPFFDSLVPDAVRSCVVVPSLEGRDEAPRGDGAFECRGDAARGAAAGDWMLVVVGFCNGFLALESRELSGGFPPGFFVRWLALPVCDSRFVALPLAFPSFFCGEAPRFVFGRFDLLSSSIFPGVTPP